MATPPLMTDEQRRTLDSKDWKMPDVTPVVIPQRAQAVTPGQRRPLPEGNFYKIGINYHMGEREFEETHYICLADGIVMNHQFQSYFLRYWWDTEDGSQPEDDGYAYDEDLWVAEEFYTCTQIPSTLMRAMYEADLVNSPMIYGRTIYNQWTNDRARYREFHDLEDDWDE